MIPRGAEVRSEAELTALLRRWLRETDEPTIGDAARFGAGPWVFMNFAELPRRAKLNADTTRLAVCEFLDYVGGGSLISWRVIANKRGPINKVVYAMDDRDLPGWYCYLT